IFSALPPAKREQFLRAGNAHLTACSMWPHQRTAYAVFLVIACEALKPIGRRHDRMNMYDVVASLDSRVEAEQLRGLSFHPQRLRSKHVHRGELASDELVPLLSHDPFKDPSFDEMIDVLSRISSTCLIEWLRCKGNYTLVRLWRGKGTLAER